VGTPGYQLLGFVAVEQPANAALLPLLQQVEGFSSLAIAVFEF
jgi:hypothetical protein